MTSTCSNNLKSAKSQSRATWWAECTNTGNRFLTMSCTALFFICTSMKSWNLRGGCSFSFNSPAVYFMHTAGACWYFVHSGCTFKPKLSLYCVLLTVLFYLHLKGRRWSEIKASDKRISDSNVDFCTPLLRVFSYTFHLGHNVDKADIWIQGKQMNLLPAFKSQTAAGAQIFSLSQREKPAKREWVQEISRVHLRGMTPPEGVFHILRKSSESWEMSVCMFVCTFLLNSLTRKQNRW